MIHFFILLEGLKMFKSDRGGVGTVINYIFSDISF